MKRLFTFGCSMTRYVWPTWAEMLGNEYDHFENWGNSGIGNRAILERLTECIVNNNITEDDTIIVQWTEFHRFDIHLPQPLMPEGWVQTGNLLHPSSPKWIQQHWDEKSYIMHSLNFIKLGIVLLSSLPCKWYMTTFTDLKSVVDQYPQFTNYTEIFSHPNFLPPMSSFFDQYNFPKKKLIRDSKEPEEDEHPTPIGHYGWLVENLSPLLNVNIDEDWATMAHNILFDHCTHYISVNDQYLQRLNWSRAKHWIYGVLEDNSMYHLQKTSNEVRENYNS